MNTNTLNFICDPKTHQKLIQSGSYLITEDHKTKYPIIDGIPVFLQEGDVTGLNKKYQKLYDRIGKFTGSVYWLICKIFRLDLISIRKDLLSNLGVQDGDCVLETSIGAGANIPALNPKAHYIGVDISMSMLKACLRHPLIKPYDLQLIQANAEYLPFKDNSFDVVFHVGGINFFNDIPQAIHEMIRVAKPGAQILICDETQKHIDTWYKKIPFVGTYFANTPTVDAPTSLIPETMEIIKLEYKMDGTMWVITFRKPV